ncbi:MAG: Mur ligase family protein, partial [Prevotella denticola]
MNYTIEKVTTLIGARRYGDKDADISFVLTDSRSLCFPEETLFFALKSERNDGHNYIPELYGRGVRNFVVETVPEDWNKRYPDSNFLKVVGSLEALQRLAERHRDEYLIPVVGITGSNGKTMVKEWLYQLLSPQMVVTRSPRSYNSQIGVPLSVLLLNENTQVGVFEAGISQPGEMSALRDIIQPTIGVFTCLGSAHQENFPSLEAKCKEKLHLFHDTQAIVYSLDDEVLNRCLDEYDYKGEKLCWSAKDEKAVFYIKSIEKKDVETTVTYTWKNGKEAQYRLPFIDDASVENSITCAVTALQLGVTPAALGERMAQLEPVAMRLEVKEGQHGCTLINDSYNSDFNSLDIALDFMNRRPDHKGRRRTLILSDILQSGDTDKDLYNKVAFLCEKRGVEKFIGIGEGLLGQRSAFRHLGKKHFFATVNAFIHSDVFANLHDEVILLKGARQFGFDRLTELLVKKVHETVLEVNLNAVVDNLNWYRSFLKPETTRVCMIQADAYGAGAVEIAKTLQDHRVDYL